VRSLPAKPVSVAAFVRYQQDRGVPRPMIAESLTAIEELHFAASQSNPCATPVVRTTTGSTIEPPRSWTKSEQLLFTGLPPEVAAVIARREQDREKTLRRCQNELAELKKRQQADAERTADNRKENDNADQRRPVQP
jgi:hypothetical protein